MQRFKWVCPGCQKAYAVNSTKGLTLCPSCTASDRPRIRPSAKIYAAIFSSIAILLGIAVWATVYWRSGTSTSPAAALTPALSPRTPETNGAVDDLELSIFRKAVAKTLACAYGTTEFVKRHADFNAKMSDGGESQVILVELRSLVGVPPKWLTKRQEINQKLDDLVTAFHKATIALKPHLAPVKTQTFAQIMDRLQSLDGHRLSADTIVLFDKVTIIADSIAADLGIDFDEKHRTDRFHEAATDFIAATRKCIGHLRSLPETPTEVSIIRLHLGDATSHTVTLRWALMREPPSNFPDREHVISDLSRIHKPMYFANVNYECTYDCVDVLSKNELRTLRKLYDDALSEASEHCDKLETRLKKGGE